MKSKIVKNKNLVNVGEIQETNSYLTCAEYFAGIGLVRIGLEQAHWHITFANDWSHHKFEMYSAHFQNSSQHYKVQDIFSIDPEHVPNTLLATASFPCTDLSLAGHFQGLNGEQSKAFWGLTQILEKQLTKPKLVMLENVSGWITSNGGQDFRIVIQALNRLGYVCDVFTIDAAHFVPQSRPRIFVIGIQKNRGNQDIFILSRRSSCLKTQTLEKAILSNLDLGWNFLEIPQLPQKIKPNLSSIVETLTDDDQRWWSDHEIERHLTMMSSVNIDYLKELKELPFFSYCTMYRRVRQGQQKAELRKDGFAGCLRTARGGSSRQMLVRVGQQSIRMRLMTPREYARLQGVPDDYPLPSQVNQALSGFGDAVCVPVITWIAENILNPLTQSFQEKGLISQN